MSGKARKMVLVNFTDYQTSINQQQQQQQIPELKQYDDEQGRVFRNKKLSTEDKLRINSYLLGNKRRVQHDKNQQVSDLINKLQKLTMSGKEDDEDGQISKRTFSSLPHDSQASPSPKKRSKYEDLREIMKSNEKHEDLSNLSPPPHYTSDEDFDSSWNQTKNENSFSDVLKKNISALSTSAASPATPTTAHILSEDDDDIAFSTPRSNQLTSPASRNSSSSPNKKKTSRSNNTPFARGGPVQRSPVRRSPVLLRASTKQTVDDIRREAAAADTEKKKQNRRRSGSGKKKKNQHDYSFIDTTNSSSNQQGSGFRAIKWLQMNLL